MIYNYILNEKNEPVLEDDPLKFAEWCKRNSRVIATTDLGKGYRLSTVFTGVFHGYKNAVPMVFEVVLFSDGLRSRQYGYGSTMDWAKEKHAEIVDSWVST